ncbi:baseplate hub subunit and tail lysozyme [Pseudomonas phage vB_PaeM_MIJ3]|nr:baseplate hub subunit and tail lysozyme [Pseudomonas phage vB_PaeM_MIJ3]
MSTYSRTVGVNPSASKTPTGRAQKYYGMYIGFVKDNVDSNRMGRLRVWVPEFGTDPSDESGWLLVGYCSPFAGATNPMTIGGSQDVSAFHETQTSYGMWAVPPDLENQVAVMFANGDPAKGFWFGCIWQQQMNHMIPAVAGSVNNYETAGKSLPVGEYNKNTLEKVNAQTINKPVASLAQGLKTQGLINDNIRGVSSSSARREAPSQVFGILTPGPVIDGANARRHGGHQFVMDDAPTSEHITLRTRSGAQIRLDETNGIIYIINKLGTAWIELDNSGNVDVFGAKSGSLRFMEDFNIRADRDINIEAGRNINIKASKDYTTVSTGGIAPELTGQGGDIFIQANNNLNIQSQKDTLLNQLGGSLHNTAGVDISLKAGSNYNLQAAGQIATATNGTYGLSAGGDIIELGANIHMNGPQPPTPDSPTEASTPTTNGKTNILPEFSDANRYNRMSQPGVTTIVSRFNTFEPCPEHKNKGA